MGSTPNGGKRGRGKGGLGSRDDEWKWKCESERRLETGFLEGAGRASESKQASACATTKRVTGRCVHSLVGRDASLLLLLISRPPFDRHQCCAQNKQNKTKQSSRSSKKKKKKTIVLLFHLLSVGHLGRCRPLGLIIRRARHVEIDSRQSVCVRTLQRSFRHPNDLLPPCC